MNTQAQLLEMLARRLPAEGRAWLDGARAEVARGVDEERFCALYSLTSRHTPRGALSPDAAELAHAAQVLPGWSPERWSTLDAVRVTLVLSRDDLESTNAARAVEELFRFADMGELCAAYRALAHLPAAERFVWRAGEGARSSMKAVYEAACCDTPYPARYFDAVAWRQALVKALFIEAPLWRVWGVDGRLDEELARMVLDLAEERRSAGRPVNPESWMCLGPFGGERALASLERELASGPPAGRAGALLALARAGKRERLSALVASDKDPLVQAALRSALAGRHASTDYAVLDPQHQGAR